MRALLLVLATWTSLAAGSLLAPRLGVGLAVLASFGLAVALSVATRARRPRFHRAPSPHFVLALLAGYASYPAWVALIIAAGLGLGLAPIAATLPGAGDPAAWTAQLALAPVFEELVYRERVIDDWSPRLGGAGAIAAGSLLFALPHIAPWSMLGSFLVGLGLGATYWRLRSPTVCIALHAGLNLAAIVCGAPPARLAAPPAMAALLGTGLLVAAGFAQQRLRRD